MGVSYRCNGLIMQSAQREKAGRQPQMPSWPILSISHRTHELIQ
jgi:hypothetical protein